MSYGVRYSLIRTSDLRSKVLSLGKFKIDFDFHSLIRTSDLRSKVLSLGKFKIDFDFLSLIRTFASTKGI